MNPATVYLVCHGLSKFYRKSRNFLSGYLIRLTRGYTDGGMDSRSE
jgi:hypothetical protein